MSGGAKTDDLAFLETVASASDAGAKGLAVGRNVFQRENPTQILDALERVIFEEEGAEAALEAASEDGGDGQGAASMSD
jgi:class I fructose-bisphosphate aldolase